MEFDPRWPTTYGAKEFLYARWWARKGHLVPVQKIQTEATASVEVEKTVEKVRG